MSDVRTCDHIKTDGSICRSPAMRGSAFCYFHTRDHQRRRNLSQASDLKTTQPHSDALEAEIMRALALPDLEDAHAVQVALSAVIRGLALGHVSIHRANLLLRGLRSAIVNLRNLPPFEETSEIATDDFEPIYPLISPCAPDPWLVKEEASSTDCHPERSEGPLPSSGASNGCHPERSEGPAVDEGCAAAVPFPAEPDLNVN